MPYTGLPAFTTDRLVAQLGSWRPGVYIVRLVPGGTDGCRRPISNQGGNGMRYRQAVTFVFLLCAVAASVSASQKKPASQVKPGSLGKTRNVHTCGSLFLAGQPTPADITAIVDSGIKRVITLRTDSEIDWDEAQAFDDVGVELVKIPFRAPNTLSDGVFDRVRRLLREAARKPTLLHCGSANRVGAVWLVHRVLDEGVPLQTAVGEARTIGLRTPAYERRAREYIAEQQAQTRPKETSVRPGINARFLDPKMDIEEWLARFEIESREIFKNRQAVLAALQLKPGMRVGDIGAGTGFFARAMAERVGAAGWVYAVDISPRFVEHLSRVASQVKRRNLTPVMGGDDTVRLAPNSIDIAFVCDTYHHFEYPKSTLASIHRALRPRGTLVLIDFERIEGKSREFVLNHVRAGKETFRAEVEAAGFALIEQVEVAGLRENYFLRFGKR